MTTNETPKTTNFLPGQEDLPPQLSADYGRAVELAGEENKAFDQRRSEAISLARVNDDFDVDDKRPFVSIREQKYDAADGRLNLYKSAASALMPPRAVFEKIERYDAPIAREELWQAMTPEQQHEARELRAAIAEGPLREYGVTWESLRVIRVVGRDEDSLGLVHVGTGIDIGDPKDFRDPSRSYEAVMSAENDHLFQVQVDGATYDSRQGMTRGAYYARGNEVTDQLHLPHPDAIRKSADIVHVNYVMLTGEPLNHSGQVEVMTYNESKTYPSDANYGHLLVCPAVLFGTIEK